MNRTYRFKMRPTEEQKQFLSKGFGCSRFVYNYALSLKIEAYKSEKKNLSFFDLCASIRKLKEQPEYEWLKEVPALTLNYALLNLNSAYAHFFKTKAGFPKYKSKKRCRDAAKFDPGSVKYDFKAFSVKLPKAGRVRLCRERAFDPSAVRMQSTTVVRDRCGDYWCCVAVDDGLVPEPKAKVREETAAGIDVGLSDFAVLSDGTRVPNRRFSEREEHRLAKMQRGLSRKRRGAKDTPPSKRYLRFRTKIAKLHRKVENRRADFLHKTTTDLVRRYDTLCVENLNVKGMMANHSLAGAVGSASWSAFVRMLEYKAGWYGKTVLKAGRFAATTQICSACGCRNADVKNLAVREWTCPQCGTRHDRDVNAAMNIKAFSLKEYFNKQSPAVTGITDADGADSESDAGTGFPERNYASVETSTQKRFSTKFCDYPKLETRKTIEP